MSSPARTARSQASLHPSQLSYAFKPNGKNDDRSGYIRQAMVRGQTGLYYDLPSMTIGGRKDVRTINMAKTSADRDSYIRATHMPSAPYVDLPGMAESAVKRCKSPNLARASSSGDRCAQLLRQPFPMSTYVDLPGIAESILKSPRGSYPFKSGREVQIVGMDKGRLKVLESPNKTIPVSPAHNLSYDVPGMAEELSRSRKGSLAFRVSSPRFKSPGTPQTPSVRNGCASDGEKTPPRTMSPGHRRGTPLSTQSRPSSPPGIAEAILKSPRGTLAFRTSSVRDSYIRAFPKTNDLCYDVPGMSGVIYSSPKSETHKAGANACGVVRRVESPLRYVSPTRSSEIRAKLAHEQRRQIERTRALQAEGDINAQSVRSRLSLSMDTRSLDMSA